MSKSEKELNGLPVPTTNEMERLLFEMKPRPTARLQEKMRRAPWHTEQGDTSVIRLRRMELAVTGAAVLLLVLIAAVVLMERSPLEETTIGAGTNNETNQGTEQENAGAPIPTRSDPPTPAVPEGSANWTVTLPGGTGESDRRATGVVFEAEQGRLYVANGYEGVERFSKSGESLGAIALMDPATGAAVFVRDVAWSLLQGLGSTDFGLIVLTDPFESGDYLHIVNPESGEIERSITHNGNIAIPATTDFVAELPPSNLSASDNGELFADRVYTFAPETAGGANRSFFYLLRSIVDGRILNSKAVGEEMADEPSQMITEIAYSGVMDSVYAAVWHETSGIVQKFSLTGTPRLLATLDNGLVRWQEGVAISTDARGHVYILVDLPGYIVELDQDDAVVNVFGFRDLERWDGNTAVTYWLPGGVGRPLAMAAAPDGSMLFVVDEVEGEIRLRAFESGGESAVE